MQKSFLVALLVLASPLARAADVPADVTAKIAEADRLRLKEWDKDGQSEKAVTSYQDALKAGADPYEMHWKTASALFWEGEALNPDKDGKKLEALGQRCIDEANAATKIKPDAIEGQYYTAVCWGEYSHGISIPSALMKGVEGKFKGALDRAMKVDPDFQDGAPLNAYGRFYFELPWPKRDLKKSEEYLRRNIKDTPCNLRTRVYFAETILKNGKEVDSKPAKTVAKENLQFVLDNKHCDANPPDGEQAKRNAKKLLDSLK